jgi:hypothetical protein
MKKKKSTYMTGKLCRELRHVSVGFIALHPFSLGL